MMSAQKWHFLNGQPVVLNFFLHFINEGSAGDVYIATSNQDWKEAPAKMNDDRVIRVLKVIVASCGWTFMDYYKEGRLDPWAQEVYMPLVRDKYGLDPEKVPFDFDGVIAALALRAFFSNSFLNDSNFEVKGVRKGIAATADVYRFLGAEDNLQVRYPDAGHDFPTRVCLEAYHFIDKVLEHTPNHQNIQ